MLLIYVTSQYQAPAAAFGMTYAVLDPVACACHQKHDDWKSLFAEVK